MTDVQILIIAAIGYVVFRLNNVVVLTIVCFCVVIVYVVKVFLPFL